MMVIKPRKLISIMSHDRRSQITAKVISSTARLSEEESRAKHSIKVEHVSEDNWQAAKPQSLQHDQQLCGANL